MAKTTFYVDSSLVAATIGASVPDHVAEVQRTVAGGKLAMTVYVRMEFIRRVVCDLIRAAHMADQCSSVDEFWRYYGEGFDTRRLKTGFFALSVGGQNLRTADTPRALAEEFATLAVGILKMADAALPQSINPSKCQIGARKLKVDYNNLLCDAGQFAIDFEKVIEDCEINAFLKLSNANSTANRVMDDADASKATAAVNLRSLKQKAEWITCKSCKKIGDVVIALEFPPRATLVDGDRESFPKFCAVLGKKEVYVKSIQAIEHEKPGWLWKVSGKLPDSI